MALDQDISDFLRDAQYRIAELTTEKNKLHKRRDTERYKAINRKITACYRFMYVLWEPTDSIYGELSGYIADFTDDQIISQIEYYRELLNMVDVPVMDFVGFNQTVVFNSSSSGQSSSNLLSSSIGNIAYYITTEKLGGKAVSKYAGRIEDDIDEYFAGTTDPNKLEFPFVVLPSYEAATWTAKNPLLKRGQAGFLIDENGLVVNYKVGPGYWNDLTFLSGGFYSYDEDVSSPIGDATGNLVGLPLGEVLRLMLNPYVAPVLSDAKNNAGGSYVNELVKEIGQSISGTVNVQYTVSNSSNLSGATPINVTAGGRFSNEGGFANGTIGLTLAATLTPTLVTNILISIVATHTNGTSNTILTYIRFRPKIIWGVSQSDTITNADLLNGSGLQDRQTKISDSYKHDYTFNQAGYLYVAIPTMLSPASMSWADVTDTQIISGIDMVDLGVKSAVNNGVGTYNYQLFRSKYAITEAKTIISIE